MIPGLAGFASNPLIAMGTGLLSASGYSPTPISMGQGLAQGFRNMQAAQRMSLANALTQAQIDKMEAEREQRKRAQEQMLAQQQARQRLMQTLPEKQRQALGLLAEAYPKIAGERIAGLLAPTPAEPTSTMREYEMAQAQGFQGTLEDWKRAMAQAGRSTVSVTNVLGGQQQPYLTPQEKAAIGIPENVVAQRTKEGATRIIYKPSEETIKAGGFAGRMSMAEFDEHRVGDETQISGLSALESDPTALPAITDWWEHTKLRRGGLLGESQVDPKMKAYAQYAQRWIAALLRRESGATVTDEEFERYFATYFAAPGDTPQILEQKRRARLMEAEAVAQAGNLRRTIDAPESIPPPPGSVRIP